MGMKRKKNKPGEETSAVLKRDAFVHWLINERKPGQGPDEAPAVWTAYDLAQHMKMHPSAVHLVIAGKRRPGQKFISELTRVSGKPASHFFDLPWEREAASV